jgi:hypothetical protein
MFVMMYKLEISFPISYKMAKNIAIKCLARANPIKLFTAVIKDFRNKLECLSVASFSSLV